MSSIQSSVFLCTFTYWCSGLINEYRPCQKKNIKNLFKPICLYKLYIVKILDGHCNGVVLLPKVFKGSNFYDQFVNDVRTESAICGHHGFIDRSKIYGRLCVHSSVDIKATVELLSIFLTLNGLFHFRVLIMEVSDRLATSMP